MLNQSFGSPRRFVRAGVLLAFVATVSAGCASQSKKWKFATWDVRKAVGLKKDDEKPAPQVPIRLVATWTETVLNTVGQKPKRGFGGRIAFFKRDSEDAVRVDGQLVVYAFDETSRPSHETHPTRKYIFPADEVVRHESESKLGPAYSFWLPWDEVGGPQRNISLIARFEPRGGPIVIGEQTKHFLPGMSLSPELPPQFANVGQADAGPGVSLAAYSTQAGGSRPEAAPTLADQPAVAEKQQMSTATIALPPRLGAAVQQLPPQQPQLQTTTLDANATAGIPLSQLSTMQAERSVLAAATPAAVPAAPTMAPAAASTTEAAPVALARPGRLRDSLLETLRAQATLNDQRAPGRAR